MRSITCSETSRRLALGTVQFGLPYGIANKTGQVSRNEAAAIVAHAWASGLVTLDTAIGYGESERRLGEIGVQLWQVITKLPEVPPSCHDVETFVQNSVAGSLERLRIRRLRSLVLHRPLQLLESRGPALYRALVAQKERGAVEGIGVSIYDPAELDALGAYYRFDLVQAPFSVIDRRLATSGWLTRLHRGGTEIHARSVFLQGLLLMDATSRPAVFGRWRALWHTWHSWLSEQGLTPLEACLGFALSHVELDRVVIGVDSLNQLQQILQAAQGRTIQPPQSLATEDVALLNPSNWTIQ